MPGSCSRGQAGCSPAPALPPLLLLSHLFTLCVTMARSDPWTCIPHNLLISGFQSRGAMQRKMALPQEAGPARAYARSWPCPHPGFYTGSGVFTWGSVVLLIDRYFSKLVSTSPALASPGRQGHRAGRGRTGFALGKGNLKHLSITHQQQENGPWA